MSAIVDLTVKVSDKEARLVKKYLELRREDDADHADAAGDAILIGTALMDGIRGRIKLYERKEIA